VYVRLGSPEIAAFPAALITLLAANPDGVLKGPLGSADALRGRVLPEVLMAESRDQLQRSVASCYWADCARRHR
jgi:hypothetical protein